MESSTKIPHREDPGVIRRFQPGNGRWFAIGLTVVFFAVVFVWIWGIRNLDGLPDVGEPFDVPTARRPIVVSDTDNAFVLYAEAKVRMSKFPAAVSKVDFSDLTWSKAGDAVHDCLEKNRPALELWREGSERPAAIYHQPGDMAVDTLLPIVQEVGVLTRMAGVEGSRREEAVELDQAWAWYCAMLRASRHVGTHGVLVERQIGAKLHELAARRILHWAVDPRVDARLLRKALGDALAADALTPPLSATLKLEYLMYLRDIEELRVMVNEIPMPGGQFGWLEQMVAATGAKPKIQRIRLSASNDVARSRRATRLLFANWLAQVDKPASERAPIAISKPTLIYALDPTAPPAARALAPEVLDKVIDHTALARAIFRSDDPASGTPMSRAPWEGTGPLAREPRRRAVLIVKLAAELYRRERGRPPATAGALWGPILQSLPEGVHPDDPIPDSVE